MNRKKTLIIAIVATILFVLTACQTTSFENLNGKFVVENDENSYLILEEDNSFEYSFNIAVSFRAKGSYKINGKNLSLITSDGTIIYEIVDAGKALELKSAPKLFDNFAQKLIIK